MIEKLKKLLRMRLYDKDAVKRLCDRNADLRERARPNDELESKASLSDMMQEQLESSMSDRREAMYDRFRANAAMVSAARAFAEREVGAARPHRAAAVDRRSTPARVAVEALGEGDAVGQDAVRVRKLLQALRGAGQGLPERVSLVGRDADGRAGAVLRRGVPRRQLCSRRFERSSSIRSARSAARRFAHMGTCTSSVIRSLGSRPSTSRTAWRTLRSRAGGGLSTKTARSFSRTRTSA
jgi:hypothetical protein